MVNTFSRTTLDAFFAALGGFALPEAHPRDVWKERLRKLWARPSMTADEIGRQLGISGRCVATHAHLMNLPPRHKCKRGGARA